MQVVETYENDNLKLEIVRDDMAESPREWDNLGTMVCWHSKYNLGDKHDFSDPKEFRQFRKDNEEHIICRPLYLYDHSGITMRTTPFSCPWDSGQVGWIYVLTETCDKEGIDWAKAEEILVGEVETYDQYLTGDIYGFICYKKTKCDKCGHVEEEETDSCWGFYGSDPKKNGMMDYFDDEVKALMN